MKKQQLKTILDKSVFLYLSQVRKQASAALAAKQTGQYTTHAYMNCNINRACTSRA
jgi:hypothetical protein